MTTRDVGVLRVVLGLACALALSTAVLAQDLGEVTRKIGANATPAAGVLITED